MLNSLIPKLWSKHPNFFVIYFATATCLHLGMAVSQLFYQDRFMTTTFVEVYGFLPIEIWAFLSFLVWIFMTLGAYYKFHIWGRLGLGIGLFICLARGMLMELGPQAGGGMFVWLTLSALHYTQLAEPPVNPLTEKS